MSPLDEAAASEERPLSELLLGLAREAKLLIEQELALARAEINEKVAAATGWTVLMALGLGLAFSAILLLLAAAVLGLALILPAWLAAIAVAGGTLLIGLVCVMLGRARLSRLDLLPERTLQALRDDLHWARDRAR